jgi:acetyl esterase/lipase
MFSNSLAIKSKLFSADSTIAALLIHGGCFTEGDETWNSDQARAISSKCNIDIFTIDFSKQSFIKSKKDIFAFFMKLYAEYKGCVGLIGCSSGGFLVLSLLGEINHPLFVTLICPVMDPEKREDLLLKMNSKQAAKIHKQQLQYFKKRPYPTAKTSEMAFDIIAAKEDDNVPLSLIESETTRFPNATLHIIEGTHAVSYKPNDTVTDMIRQSVKSAKLSCKGTTV